VLEPVKHSTVDSRRCTGRIVVIVAEGLGLAISTITGLEGTLFFRPVLLWCSRSRRDSYFNCLPFVT